MLKRFFPAPFALLCRLFLLPTLGAQAALRVAAAADLEPVLPPILAQFEQATGIHTDATYQASAVLTTQILNGAPFDLFLSADLSYPKKLIDAGAVAGAPITYAKGTLVLWERKGSHLHAPSLELLRDPGLKRLAVANPDRAPYGRAAVAALTSLKLYDALKPRLVTAENIAQAAQFVDSGNADAGLVYATDAKASSNVRVVATAPESTHDAIVYPAAVIKGSRNAEVARGFVDYLASPAAQAVFARYGFTIAAP